MPSKVAKFHEQASAEYDAAFDWYPERSPDAALRFDAEVDRAVLEILQAPQRWAAGPHSTRRFLLRHFPFTLICRERESGAIQILAVAHTSRKPGYWKERLGGVAQLLIDVVGAIYAEGTPSLRFFATGVGNVDARPKQNRIHLQHRRPPVKKNAKDGHLSVSSTQRSLKVGQPPDYRPKPGGVLNQIPFGASDRAATMSGQPSPLKSANANPYTVPLPSFQRTSRKLCAPVL